MSEIRILTDTPAAVETRDRDARKSPSKSSSKRDASPKAFTSKEVTLSQVTQAVAQARRIDATKAGKLVRSFLRSNHDALKNGRGDVPKWDALKSKDRADGNRYPAMSTRVANYVTRRMTARV